MIGPQNLHTNGSVMWQGNQYLNFDVQSGYQTLDEDFGFSFNTAVNSSLQDLNAIRIYINHNYGTNSFNTSVLLQVMYLILPKYLIYTFFFLNINYSILFFTITNIYFTLYIDKSKIRNISGVDW